MKKLIPIVFLLVFPICYGQQTHVILNPTKKFSVGIYSGISVPSSSLNEKAFFSNGSFFELNGAYYFSTIGLGASYGLIKNPSKEYNNLNSSQAFPTQNVLSDYKTSFLGIGPEIAKKLNNFEISIKTRIGSLTLKENQLSASVVSTIDDTTTLFPFETISLEKTNVGFFSAGLGVGYSINNISFSLYGNLIGSLSDVKITRNNKEVIDRNKNGIIDQEDFLNPDGTPIDFSSQETKIKPSLINFGVGLNYVLPIKSRDPIDIENIKESPKIRNPIKDNNYGLNNIVLTNLSKKKKNQERKIESVLPINNASFSSDDEIKLFTWKLLGERIMQPNYAITISKIGSNQREKWTLSATTSSTSISIKDLLKQNNFNKQINERSGDENYFSNGLYRWWVTELSTGISSNTSYFTMNNCDITFSITNETVECLGYEGENRRYKICFDATYVSPTGNLTYLNAGSGLSVFDQSYSALSYTLVSPNLTLVSQNGSSISTVTYCFEVVVGPSVTAIGFGLQGDDLDPSPIVCQPGASLLIDELPDCICDDCEEMEVNFTNFNIAPTNQQANQFTFSGNISVNQPIYGLEFQIQNYSYSANPNSCSNGINYLEESGVFLMPGCSINNATSIQLSNETVSGSSLSNTNATKNIKYISNSALNGNIPVTFNIGLPGPLSGLDPSCCLIDYDVCIKVIIYYDSESCKSCEFIHCFQFNNQ